MKIIVITGPDAAGKSSQIEILKGWLGRTLRVSVVSIWDSLKEFRGLPKDSLAEVLNTFLLNFHPEARSYFLASALRNSMEMRGDADVLLVSGYTYKYWASEMTYGVSKKFWKTIHDSFPKPDALIYLDVDLTTCMARRSQWSAYESGQAKYLRSSRKDLLEFQEEMHGHLRDISLENGAHLIKGNRSPEDISRILKSAIGQFEFRVPELHPC